MLAFPMIRIYCLLLLTVASCGTGGKKEESQALSGLHPKETIADEGRIVPVYDFKGMESLLQKTDGKTYLINFWATWCAPCIKELPHFERVAAEYPDSVEVLLVSLDMPAMWNTSLMPFIREHQLQSQVLVLDDPRQNDWIPRVHESWSGAIPATLIYNSGKRKFYEQPFSYEELVKELTYFLNDN